MRELKLLTDVGGRFDEGAGVYFNVKRGDIVKAPPGRPFATPLWR